MAHQIAENLARIRAEIEKSAQDSGRNLGQNLGRDSAQHSSRKGGAVTLVAVSKKQPPERVDAALAAGVRVFGENRLQEAEGRWTPRRGGYPGLELHLIGPLQTDKAGAAVGFFDVIETLDREKLARILATEMARQSRHVPCFVQVNTGAEPQKSGIAPDEAAGFVDFCRHDLGLTITGLMCIPPVDEEAAIHFALLRVLADRMGLANLSMGMSGDYTEAIQFGATHIRVGSALFGPRPG